MKLRVYNNRYLQLFADEGETIEVAEESISETPDAQLDLQDVIGIEGVQGGTGGIGKRGQSAKEVLIEAGILNEDATDAEFYEAIKGDDGADGTNGTNGEDGVGILSVVVSSVRNTFVERYECDGFGICKLRENLESSLAGTCTTITVTLTDGTTQDFDILAESGGSSVSMNAQDYKNYFGTTEVDPTSGIVTYTRNDVTIYVVPISAL